MNRGYPHFRNPLRRTVGMGENLGVYGSTKWAPQTIAKLVHITPINMVKYTHITILNVAYTQTYNWWAPHYNWI